MQRNWYPRNYYILRHNKTGKMYIGQRERCDVGTTYFGSGVDWCRHRKEYGWKDITVIETNYFTDKDHAQMWLDHQEVVYGEYWLADEFANKVPETTDDKATQKGFKHSEETKRMMSEVRKGRPQAGGVKHHSEESKKNMSDQRKGRKLTDEDKRKKSESQKGKPKTEEHKMAMRIPKVKVECEGCGRIIGSHNIKRHQRVCNFTSLPVSRD